MLLLLTSFSLWFLLLYFLLIFPVHRKMCVYVCKPYSVARMPLLSYKMKIKWLMCSCVYAQMVIVLSEFHFLLLFRLFTISVLVCCHGPSQTRDIVPNATPWRYGACNNSLRLIEFNWDAMRSASFRFVSIGRRPEIDTDMCGDDDGRQRQTLQIVCARTHEK